MCVRTELFSYCMKVRVLLFSEMKKNVQPHLYVNSDSNYIDQSLFLLFLYGALLTNQMQFKVLVSD